jgi:hypothetical protein
MFRKQFPSSVKLKKLITIGLFNEVLSFEKVKGWWAMKIIAWTK